MMSIGLPFQFSEKSLAGFMRTQRSNPTLSVSGKGAISDRCFWRFSAMRENQEPTRSISFPMNYRPLTVFYLLQQLNCLLVGETKREEHSRVTGKTIKTQNKFVGFFSCFLQLDNDYKDTNFEDWRQFPLFLCIIYKNITLRDPQGWYCHAHIVKTSTCL